MAALDSVWGNTHLKRSETFNAQLKEMFLDQLFAQAWVRMINDFGDGDNYKISTLGELTIDQMSESVALPERRPDTGQFVFNINEFVGVKVPYTDKFLEDDFLAPAAIAALPRKMKRAFDEYFESQVLKLQRVQTNNTSNLINTARHRYVGNGAARQMTLQDLAYARYAMQKAKAPLSNLIAIVDPSFEFNVNITSTLADVSFNPRWEGLIETGMGLPDGIRWLRNVYGWDIYVSDYLDTEQAVEAALTDYLGNTTATVVGDKANQFMCLADDECKPYIGAWRRSPKITSWRDEDIETEYHQLSARFGLNLYRPESLVTIFTSTTLN